jgi:hypothetical protein
MEPLLAADAAQADWLARGLGIGGLAVSLVATLVAWLAYRRDRPQLTLGWQANEIVPELEVTALNVGRQPVALRSIEIRDYRAPLWVRWWMVARLFAPLIKRLRGDLAYGSLNLAPTEPLESAVVLQPGEPFVCTFEAQRVLTLANARPTWVVATDPLAASLVEQRLTPQLLDVLRVSVRGRDLI